MIPHDDNDPARGIWIGLVIGVSIWFCVALALVNVVTGGR